MKQKGGHYFDSEILVLVKLVAKLPIDFSKARILLQGRGFGWPIGHGKEKAQRPFLLFPKPTS